MPQIQLFTDLAESDQEAFSAGASQFSVASGFLNDIIPPSIRNSLAFQTTASQLKAFFANSFYWLK